MPLGEVIVKFVAAKSNRSAAYGAIDHATHCVYPRRAGRGARYFQAGHLKAAYLDLHRICRWRDGRCPEIDLADAFIRDIRFERLMELLPFTSLPHAGRGPIDRRLVRLPSFYITGLPPVTGIVAPEM
jgi:hypothetical protein